MENIPKETETIAARRAARIAEKLRLAGEGLAGKKAWWSNEPMELLILIFVFAINFYLVYPFFGTPAPQTHYSGPIVPLITSLVSLFKVQTSYAIQIVYIAFILLFPLSFYLFIKKISGRKMVALFAVMIASFPTVPFLRTRVEAALTGVEGPHVVSLTLMPLAVFGLLAFLHTGGLKNIILASISAALVALTSPFGFITYVIFAGITTFSEVLLGKGKLKLIRFIAVMILVGGFCSFWYNPAFFIWMVKGPMGKEVTGTISNLVPILTFTLPVLGVLGYLLFDRKPNLQPLFLALFFTTAYAMVVFAGSGFVYSHPSRYLSELGISFALLISIGIVAISDRVMFMEKGVGRVSSKLLANGITVISFLILLFGIILGKGWFMNSQVLGIWEEINKGDIWIAREGFNIFWQISGYVITGVTFTTLTILGIRSQTAKPGI